MIGAVGESRADSTRLLVWARLAKRPLGEGSPVEVGLRAVASLEAQVQAAQEGNVLRQLPVEVQRVRESVGDRETVLSARVLRVRRRVVRARTPRHVPQRVAVGQEALVVRLEAEVVLQRLRLARAVVARRQPHTAVAENTTNSRICWTAHFFAKTAKYWLFGTRSRFDTSRNPFDSTSLIRSA